VTSNNELERTVRHRSAQPRRPGNGASRIKALLGDRIYKQLSVVDRNIETSRTFTVAFARRNPIPGVQAAGNLQEGRGP
jgi:hypothetical protein